MAPCRFGRYELLTTDVPAARGFYGEIFGSEFWGADVTLGPLPEAARARGARPHFRGHLAVPQVEPPLARVLAEGGQQLGPLQMGPGAVRAGVVDPFGARLTLSSEAMPAPRALVAWHLMLAREHTRACAWYAELFGWKPGQLRDLGPERGEHQAFAWQDGGEKIGSFSNLARLPEVHPQWLFFFRVRDIERAVSAVRALGGRALPSQRTADDSVVVACDDPQGGAFGLFSRNDSRRA
jgi:predicted enzyme related to lactoylglutathione lyase